MAPERTSKPTLIGKVRRVPRNVLLRLALLIGVAASGVALLRWPPVAQHLTAESLTAAFERFGGFWWAPLALLLAYAVVAPLGLPISPVVVTGGAVFGVVLGSVYNTVGLFLGSGLSYLLARALGRDAIVHFAGNRLRKVERAFERRGFWPLVQIRFMPLPFALVNYGAALAGVRLSRFLLTTAIGLLPATFMHTYFAARVTRAPEGERTGVLIAWAAVWAALALTAGLPAVRDGLLRRRRYRDLLAHRAQRHRG